MVFRTWVIQELSLSKQAITMCGRDMEEWSLLVKPMSFTSGSVLDPLRGVDGPTHLENLLSIGKSPHFDIVLKYSSLCKATDTRDKIYGLLGLLKSPMIPIDYSLSVDTVYRKFTQTIVENARNIDQLHWFGM